MMAMMTMNSCRLQCIVNYSNPKAFSYNFRLNRQAFSQLQNSNGALERPSTECVIEIYIYSPINDQLRDLNCVDISLKYFIKGQRLLKLKQLAEKEGVEETAMDIVDTKQLLERCMLRTIYNNKIFRLNYPNCTSRKALK